MTNDLTARSELLSDKSLDSDIGEDILTDTDIGENVGVDTLTILDGISNGKEKDLKTHIDSTSHETEAPTQLSAGKSEQTNISGIEQQAAPIDRIQLKFKNQESIQIHCERAIHDMDTRYGEKYGLDIQSLVENRDLSLSSIAQKADLAGLGPTQTGTLVHRVAEIRGLQDHTQEVIDGIRLLEQSIHAEDGKRLELDHVIIRGDTHYIRDYKPINIADVINEQPWGQDFHDWINRIYGGDYTKIRNMFNRDMPGDLQEKVRGYLSNEMMRYKKQMEGYRQAYKSQKGLAENIKVKTAIHPYFVYRP